MFVVTPSVVLSFGSPSKLIQVPRGPQKDGDLQGRAPRGRLWYPGHREPAGRTPGLTATPVPSDLGGCSQGLVSCCDGEPSASSLWGQEVLERVAPGPALGYGLALLSVGEPGD